MPAFELVAAALPIAAGANSARPAAITAPPIHVFMRALPRQAQQPCKTGPQLAGPSQLTHTRAAGITSGPSGDDDADDNPNGGGDADDNPSGGGDGGGASALRW